MGSRGRAVDGDGLNPSDRSSAAAPGRVARNRVTSVTLGLAAVWAGLLIVGALNLHRSSDGGLTFQTQVERDGAKVLALVAIPLLAVVFVAAALWWRRRTGRSGTGPLEWLVCGLLCVVTAVGVLTVGPLVAPVAGLLTVACGCAAAAPAS